MEISGNLLILTSSGNLKYTLGIFVYQVLFFLRDAIRNTQQADVSLRGYKKLQNYRTHF